MCFSDQYSRHGLSKTRPKQIIQDFLSLQCENAICLKLGCCRSSITAVQSSVQKVRKRQKKKPTTTLDKMLSVHRACHPHCNSNCSVATIETSITLNLLYWQCIHKVSWEIVGIALEPILNAITAHLFSKCCSQPAHLLAKRHFVFLVIAFYEHSK